MREGGGTRESGILRVFVEDAAAEPVSGIVLRLRATGERRYRKLRTGAQPGVFEITKVVPGSYELEAIPVDKDLQPERYILKLAEGENTRTVVVGSRNQPFHYAQDTRVYFTPDRRAFLLSARGESAAQIVSRLLEKKSLENHPVSRGLPEGHPARRDGDTAFLIVKLPGSQTIEESGGLISELANELRQQGLDVALAAVVQRGDKVLYGLTNELVVRFHESITYEEIQRIARELGLSVLRPIRYAGNTFLLAWPAGPSYQTLQIAQALHDKYPVHYAEPNVLMPLVKDQYTPNDPLWGDLTHLTLMNCDDAWQVLGDIDPNSRGGSADITIAVLDPDGVAPNHSELIAMLTDGTSKLVTSYNFVDMTLQTVAQLDGDHGTQCAGTATAAFDNNRGIAGVAPNCHLIGARILNSSDGVAAADALIWAAGFQTGNPNFPPSPGRPADVISNSWGVNGLVLPGLMRDCLDFLAVYGRRGKGCVVVFSIGNNGYNSFMTGSWQRDFAAYERTIAVGASINLNPTSPVNSIHPDPNGANNVTASVDTRALYSPYGTALDVVAPGHTAYAAGSGDVIDPILACVRVGTGDVDGCPGAPVCNDYEANFGATSHAAPSVAGVAALVLSVNPGLSWVEVREILRGTAKRIDSANTNSIGAYVDNDGDGVREFSQWYGYGRIDAAAAVKAARDRVFAADIVVRENLADDGSVPSAGWHAHSPDIWVRRTDDPIPTLGYSSDPPHQNPRRHQDNYVFCRVKNVGTTPSNEVYVRAMITHFPGFEFRYPQEFVPTNRPGDSVLSPITPGTYLIGEVRIDNLGVGASKIVKMTWPQALIPPEQVDVGGTIVSWHPCLLIEASPHDGPMPAGTTFDIKRDNNIAQRNLTILDPGEPTSDLFQAIVAGTSDQSGIEAICIDRSGLSADARVFVRLADPRLMRRWLHLAKQASRPSWEHSRTLADLSEKGDPCEIRVLTPASLAVTCHGHRSVIVHARPGTRIALSCSSAPVPVEITGGVYRGLDAIEIDSANPVVEIPLRLEQSVFTHLLVAVTPSTNGEELRLTQRRGSGELSAGYTLAF